MGYRRESKIYKLVFEDPDMEGLEVRAGSVSLGTFLELTQLADLASKTVTTEDIGRVDKLFRGFAKALKSWNLEDDDGPVPATVEGLYCQETDFVLMVIMAWLDAIGGVPAPLARPSSGGDQSLEASMPMEVLSPSPLS